MRARSVRLIAALWVLLLAITAGSAEAAATYYVRSGAAGAGTGADWNDAYTALPATLVRGAVYYVAGGSYGGYTFDDAVSGTQWITIRKATEADHGTETGWTREYGTSQAVFGPLRVNNANGGYIEINGRYRYGIKVDFNEGQTGLDFLSGAPNVHVLYVDFDGIASTGDYNYRSSTKAVYVHGISAVNIDGFLLSHCALHGAETVIQWEKGNNAVIEYCDFYDNRSIASNWHSNIMYITGRATNVTFRHNKIHNYNVEGLFVTGYGGSGSGNWYIYGNVFYDGVSVARGLELRQDYSYGAFYFYNNTCINLPVGCVNNIANSTSGGAGRNNIAYNAGFTWGAIPNSDNVRVSSDAFVDFAGKDYRLAAPTQSGTRLASPFDEDPDGAVRGADGTWDLGAYEYVSGGGGEPVSHTVTPSAGPNGSISPAAVQTVNDGQSAQFTVTPNEGYATEVGGTCGGTLAGTLFTTNAVTADCTVTVTFTQLPGATRPAPPQDVMVE